MIYKNGLFTDSCMKKKNTCLYKTIINDLLFIRIRNHCYQKQANKQKVFKFHSETFDYINELRVPEIGLVYKCKEVTIKLNKSLFSLKRPQN